VPQFVRPDSAMPVATQIGILGVTSVVPEFFVLLAYGALAARAATLARDPRAMRTFDRASGVCLIACAGLALAA
jgi:homoserine/homoserine lactone efflux protein